MRASNETASQHQSRLVAEGAKRKLQFSVEQNYKLLSDRIDEVQEAVVAIAKSLVELREKMK